MFHALYIAAFLILTVIAVSNLVRNMMLLGSDTRRSSRPTGAAGSTNQGSVAHPEMLDEAGRVTKEPLLVMRSISLQDARQQLENLYDGNQPASADETVDEQE